MNHNLQNFLTSFIQGDLKEQKQTTIGDITNALQATLTTEQVIKIASVLIGNVEEQVRSRMTQIENNCKKEEETNWSSFATDEDEREFNNLDGALSAISCVHENIEGITTSEYEALNNIFF